MMRILLVALLMTAGYAAGYIAADLQWRADTLEKKLDESEARRKEEHRQNAAVNGIDHDTQNQLNKARTDAPNAAAASDRLRKELATSTARYKSQLAAERKTRTDTGLLYAELFSRANERAEQLAGYADRSTIKLHACIRSYEVVSGETYEAAIR